VLFRTFRKGGRRESDGAESSAPKKKKEPSQVDKEKQINSYSSGGKGSATGGNGGYLGC